jgi:thiol:disulfide interchange protein
MKWLAAFALALLAVPARGQTPVVWSASILEPQPFPARTQFDVRVDARIERGWHLYGLSQPAGGPPPTSLIVRPSDAFEPAGEITAPDPTAAFDPNFGVETFFFERRAVFSIPLRVGGATADGRYVQAIAISWVTCNDRFCLPPADTVLQVAVNVGAAPPRPMMAALDPTPAPPARAMTANEPRDTSGGAVKAIDDDTLALATSATSSSSLTGGSARVPDLAVASHASTLGTYVGFAALMGALSLLTPCVFPMVPITVSYFTSRARRRRRDAGLQAVVYGAGIVLTFSGIGVAVATLFGASGLNRFVSDPILNLFVTGMFVAFALSLFGAWNATLPSWLLTRATAAESGKGWLAGTLLMGLAFTLTSFTCTAPFLGTLLVIASQGEWQWPLAGMLSFSTVFALPFVVLAFVPQFLVNLPRAGRWMLSVKVTMGILELAAALKFLSNADLVWGWHIVTRPVMLAAWAMLALLLTAYYLGLVPLGPDGRLRPAWPGRVAAMASLALCLWLVRGAGGKRLGELEAFLPPTDQALASQGELEWIVNDYAGAMAQARALDRPMLIDFTGYTCTNCRWMEANMFPRPDVARELSRFVRVRLYTDGRGELYRQYQRMERELFGTVALPYYAVILPDGTPRLAFGGLTRNAAEYVAFLQQGAR